jgi:MFS family permease
MAATKTESSALLQESGKQAPEMTWRVLCTRTIVTNMVLLSLLQMLDKSDMKSTIAGMLRALELDFGIDADQEALLLVISALPLAIFAPVWGLLADSYPRFRLMIVSAIFWGLTTFISAFSQSFALLCFSRGLTAVALGGILPISQGIVADLVPNVYRGRM